MYEEETLEPGLPVKKEITSSEVEFATKESINKIIDGIKQTLEVTPPELSADIVVNGIMLAGRWRTSEKFR